ncbi:MAG TPA: lysophospholipid acyltransferase family protein [Thermoanaerobaculia bacterium]|nr:lysophospholipid acyltransferase family protein [Thermoanaerobaculia bacterium]
MLRTIWTGLIVVLATIPFATATMIVAMVKSNARVIDRIIRLWANSLVHAAGIDLRTENIEAVDRNQRYIIIANHYSYFDIPCIFAAIPQPIRFMAKISLFKIPIFGWAIGRAGFIPIDRKNRRTAVKSFELAVERIRKGNTVVVFPEEGRSRERAMRPFQRGGFLLALRSQLPILPVAIDGTFDVFSAHAKLVKPGPVTIKVGTPIPTEGLTVREKDRLLAESRTQILAMLGMGADARAEG